MNWLEAILQMVMGSASGSATPAAAQGAAISAGPGGLGMGAPFEQAMAGKGQPSTAQTFLGNIDYSKLFARPAGGAAPGGKPLPLTTLPEFPDATAQPSLQGLMAAIESRRQRLAQLGIGG